MRAAEIRKMRDESVTGRIDGSIPEDSLRSFFLAEIAAQIAELNEALKEAQGIQFARTPSEAK